MKPEDQKRFGPVEARLRDGRSAVIRPLGVGDGEALAEFYAAVPRGDFRFYCPHELDREHALAKAGGADGPESVVLVIVDPAGRIGGYAWYAWTGPAAGKSVFGICVRPGWQDSGAGRALITRILEIAPHVGPPVMSLTVQEANPRAVALYTKMGFEVVRSGMRGSRLGFDPEPEFGMERRIR